MTLAREPRDEDGIFLILWAVLAVGLFGMVAIVIDLGALRADRREQRAAADAAVTAAAHQIVTEGGPNACAVAWQYATTNLEVPSGSAPCGTFPTCTGSSWSATGTSGPYTITITHPVLEGDPLLDGDAVGGDRSVPYNSAADGAPCDRIGIRISSSRRPIFGRIFGYGSNRTSAHSVARIAPGGPGDEPASLVLLERRDCRAGRTEGVNSKLRVKAANGAAGKIQADSRGDGSCPGGTRVLEGGPGPVGSPAPAILAEHLRNAGGGIIKEARIQIHAKLFGAPNAHSPWPTEIGEPNPVGFSQVGRYPVDSRYLENVRELETAATSAVNSSSPPGFDWVNVTDPAPAGLGLGCTIDAPTPPVELSVADGKFWFNCPSGLTVRNLTIAALRAQVVIRGDLTVTATGFRINEARSVWIKGKSTGNNRGLDVGAPFVVNNAPTMTEPDRDCTSRSNPAERDEVATMFVKEGSVLVGSGLARWCQTFLYIRGANSATAASSLPTSVPGPPPSTLSRPPGNYNSIGTINVSAGAVIDWTAPNQLDTRPTEYELDTRKYEDMALWTEAHGASTLNGGGGMNLGGIYYLPNADPFTIRGNSGQNINIDAQFYVRKLTIAGGSTLNMIPNPGNQVPIPTSIVALIR